MTTPTEDRTTARQHQREVLNTIIDLLESLPDQQQHSETILSAAAIVGVKIKAFPPVTQPERFHSPLPTGGRVSRPEKFCQG